MKQLTEYDYRDRLIKEQPKTYTETPIAICVPLYNSMIFIDKYLKHVQEFDYPDNLLSLYFTVQGDDGTYEYLTERVIPHLHETRNYKTIEAVKVKQILTGEQVHVQNVVKCRNILIEMSTPDDILFMDHDNFSPPNTIRRLLQSSTLGADIVGAPYIFFQTKTGGGLGRTGFTAFFIKPTEFHYIMIDRDGYTGRFPRWIFGERLWVDAVGMGSTLIKRHVFDALRFKVRRQRTDDTDFCMRAGVMGYKILSDFGVVIQHWGFDLKILGYDKDFVNVRLRLDDTMISRRNHLKDIGIYPK